MTPYVSSIISHCPKCGIMLETYLLCSEMNVLAYISSLVLRANSRMTVARNRMSREKRSLSGIYSPSYTGASQMRPQSRRYKTLFLFPSRVARIFWISSVAKGTISEGWRERGRMKRHEESKEKRRVTWHAAGYCGAWSLPRFHFETAMFNRLKFTLTTIPFPTYLSQVEVETQIVACEMRE